MPSITTGFSVYCATSTEEATGCFPYPRVSEFIAHSAIRNSSVAATTQNEYPAFSKVDIYSHFQIPFLDHPVFHCFNFNTISSQDFRDGCNFRLTGDGALKYTVHKEFQFFAVAGVFEFLYSFCFYLSYPFSG